MKRREMIKGLAVAASTAVCGRPALAMLGMNETLPGNKGMAVPVRGLARKSGKLVQPVQVTVEHPGPDATVITRLDHQEIDRRTLAAGKRTFPVYVDPVSEPRKAVIEVEIDGKSTSLDITLEPVRKVEVFILPHSHHDLGYTDYQENVEDKQVLNISKGIELARKTADYPAGAGYVWNLEVLWGADLFLQRKSEAEKQEFFTAVKKGWIGLNGMYANELTGLCRPEEIMELFHYSNELGRKCGVKVDSAMLSDVPGFTWGTVTAMAQAGIRYFSAAPNYFDRIGTFMVEWQDKPFWWVSPSGKDKVLVWVPWTGYAMSHGSKLSLQWVGEYQKRLDDVKFPYEISYIRWSGHGDNAEPDPELSEFVKTWAEEYEWPRFTIATTSAAFSKFESRYGHDLPELKGDLTPYWEDGAGSSALETRMSRGAAERLAQCGTAAAMLAPTVSSSKDFDQVWRDVLLYSEHTWGAWNSVSDSELPFVKKQWEFKRNFAVDAENRSHALLDKVLSTYATGTDASVIDVHNTNSWARNDVIVLSKEMSSAGDHVKDSAGKPVPSQRLASGELAFLAKDVPAFGTARYHLSSEKPYSPKEGATFKSNVLSNGIVRAQIDGTTGSIVDLGLHGNARNVVDSSRGEALNEYLFFEGKDASKATSNGPVKIFVEDPGPLVASVRIESAAPGCIDLVRRVRLIAGADWIELFNLVNKKSAPLNPHPGQEDQGGEFAQHDAKESVQFAFPFAVEKGQIRVDVPLAVMRPEIDQLPGSCKNWLPVGRWIDVSNPEHGVTWATLDAPLVEIGQISTLLGSQRNPDVWRKHIAPTQKFYSWVMNNHWGTNYRAYQEGKVEFRYALRPHLNYDAAEAARFATGLSRPLIASHGSANPISLPMVRITPAADVLAMDCRTSADGNAWRLRLFGASGEDKRVKLEFPGGAPMRVWRSNLSDDRLESIGTEVEVPAWDVVTLHIERG